MLALWVLYLSFVHVGQLFYGYGWEIQLLETGLLAALPLPAVRHATVPERAAAGGRDLAVPLADRPHHARRGAHQAARRSVLARPHLPRLPLRDAAHPEPAELAGSTAAAAGSTSLASPSTTSSSWSRRCSWSAGRGGRRLFAALLFVAFQVLLILSGNLSFLNWLTIVPALACFDDALAARRSCPRGVRRSARAAAGVRPASALQHGVAGRSRRGRAAEHPRCSTCSRRTRR